MTALISLTGPGQYNQQALPVGPAFTMRFRPSERDNDPGSPGPGEYEKSSYTTEGPAYTFRSKPEDKPEGPASPGPGQAQRG